MCATLLYNTESAPRTATALARCGYELVGCACGSAGLFLSSQAPRSRAACAEAPQVPQMAHTIPAELAPRGRRARQRSRRAGARDAQQMRSVARLRPGRRRARGEAAAAPFRAPFLRVREAVRRERV